MSAPSALRQLPRPKMTWELRPVMEICDLIATIDRVKVEGLK
jgi:hypothetical protein